MGDVLTSIGYCFVGNTDTGKAIREKVDNMLNPSALSIGKKIQSCISDYIPVLKSSTKSGLLEKAVSEISGTVASPLISSEDTSSSASNNEAVTDNIDSIIVSVEKDPSKISSEVDNTAEPGGKSPYQNESFTKMNADNTVGEDPYKGAYIGFIEKKDSPVRLKIENKSSNAVRVIDRFFLTYVSYERKEKIQMMSMLDSSDMIYFFGDSPVMVSFAGVCLDTYNFQWLKEFTDLYSNEMRGSVATALGTTVKILYDDEELEGVVINMTTSKSSTSLNQGEVKFTMILTDRVSLSLTSEKPVTTVKAEDMTTMSTEAKNNIANRIFEDVIVPSGNAVGSQMKLEEPKVKAEIPLETFTVKPVGGGKE